MKIIKIILIVLAAGLIIIQFFRVEKNQHTGEQPNHISKQFNVPDDVASILKASCYDCHSNNTEYPWYTNIQPVGWWMQHHVNEGKDELNFDEFATYTPRRQYHKLEETVEMVNEDKMPLSSYTFAHSAAVLSPTQKQALLSWSEAVSEAIKAKNPGSATAKEEHKN